MTTEKQDAVDQLRKYLKPGDKVHTILRHVSRSGMTRKIDVIFIQDGVTLYLTHLVGLAVGYTSKGNGSGLVVSGCGSDMGFEVVYNLGRVLFPDGFAPSKIGLRPSDGRRVNVDVGRGEGAGPLKKEEIAHLVANKWTFPGGRNGDTSGWDEDGGYALKHEWL